MPRKRDASQRPRAAFVHTRLGGLVIVLSLTVFLIVKFEFRLAHSNAVLYAYGVTVTAVILTQMAYAILRYKDPARERGGSGSEPRAVCELHGRRSQRSAGDRTVRAFDERADIRRPGNHRRGRRLDR